MRIKIVHQIAKKKIIRVLDSTCGSDRPCPAPVVDMSGKAEDEVMLTEGPGDNDIDAVNTEFEDLDAMIPFQSSADSEPERKSSQRKLVVFARKAP